MTGVIASLKMAAFVRRFHGVLRDYYANIYYRGLGRFSTNKNEPETVASTPADPSVLQATVEPGGSTSESKPFEYRSVDKKRTKKELLAPPEYRFIYPEFLPDRGPEFRHTVREKIERMDMLKRRKHIDIPEFYVGSIIAITASDRCAPGKENRFLGICIHRTGYGLRATCHLRNVVDHQGVEIMYDLYNPSIRKIEVIKLEKRLDDSLFYLRDALPDYSTFPFDMTPVPHPDGLAVPVNPIKVKFKPRPWFKRWHLLDIKGMQDSDRIQPRLYYETTQFIPTPWEKYDLMKEYRRIIPEEEQQEIYGDVHEQQKNFEKIRKKSKKTFLHSNIFSKTET